MKRIRFGFCSEERMPVNVDIEFGQLAVIIKALEDVESPSHSVEQALKDMRGVRRDAARQAAAYLKMATEESDD